MSYLVPHAWGYKPWVKYYTHNYVLLSNNLPHPTLKKQKTKKTLLIFLASF